MGKSGKQPWANWGKRRDVRDLHSTPTSRRSLFFGRLLRASLAVILAAGLLPLLPVAPIAMIFLMSRIVLDRQQVFLGIV